MAQYLIKTLISALLVVSVAEIAKRNVFLGALVAALPMTSVLAFVWIYHDTGNTQTISELSRTIFWLVLPSLLFFQLLPWLLRVGLAFWLSLGIAMGVTGLAYVLSLKLLKMAGFV